MAEPTFARIDDAADSGTDARSEDSTCLAARSLQRRRFAEGRSVLKRLNHFLGALVAVFVVVGVPSTAFAHAGLESSDPPAGAYLDAAPERITLTFDEAITTAFGSVRVLNSSAKVVVETPLTRGAEIGRAHV